MPDGAHCARTFDGIPGYLQILFCALVVMVVFAVRGGTGFGGTATLLLFAAMLPLMWAGTVVGEKLANKISNGAFSEILAVLLLVGGVSLLVK